MNRVAFYSVHDLMPQTMDAVRGVISEIESIPAEHVMLLVVPGHEWKSSDLDTIRRWSDRGYLLAGHGWRHACKVKKDVLHQIHSWTLSRNVAEHLSCNEEEITQIIGDCFDWFEQQKLPPPKWYVPPAWALGRISLEQLRRLPFRFYEVLTGVIDSENGRFHRLPLVGYEADTWIRSSFLYLFNKLNRSMAGLVNSPLRVSIHPYDFEFHQAKPLRRFIANCNQQNAERMFGFHSADSLQWLSSQAPGPNATP